MSLFACSSWSALAFLGVLFAFDSASASAAVDAASPPREAGPLHILYLVVWIAVTGYIAYRLLRRRLVK